jgi:SAM-dependent methyltransferase
MSDQPWTLKFTHGIDMGRVQRGTRKGRQPFDGYMRGCGLQFGNLGALCDADPNYKAAFEIAQRHTLVGPGCLMNLFAIMAFYMRNIGSGHIVEFGCYRGGSALFMAFLATRFLPGVRVFAFDTFAGMPQTDQAIDVHKSGDFSDTSLESVRAYAERLNLKNIEFIPGRFEDTAVPSLARIGKVALVHIDCDIYSAIACAYDACKPHLVNGGYVVFDDPHMSSCLGALEAVEEFLIARDNLRAEQSFPHLVFRYPPLPDATAENSQK